MFLLIISIILILFGLYEEPKIGLLLAIDFLPNFVCEVNIFISVWARDLARFKVGFINTFLTILEIQAHVVIFELCVMLLDDFLAVLDLSKSAQSTRIEKLKLWIVEKVNARKCLHCKVENTNRKQFAVYSMKHMVPTFKLRIKLFVFIFAIFAFIRFILILGRDYPIGAHFLLIFIYFFLLIRSCTFRYLGISRIKKWHLAKKPFVAVPILLDLFFVDTHLVKIVQTKRLLREHRPPNFYSIFVFRFDVFTSFFIPNWLKRYLLIKILFELLLIPNGVLIIFDLFLVFT